MSRNISQQKITAHSTSIICQDTEIKGEITIGAGTIVHPKATILAIGGPIIIGSNCIIEEMSVIVNRHQKKVMRIGDFNHFMVGCRIESFSIGDYNTFQPRSKASSNIAISHHCTLSANTALLPTTDETESTLPPYTVIFGQNSERRLWDGNGQEQEKVLRAKHVEFLREIIPKFNRMRVV